MKKIFVLLFVGVATAVLSGCASQSAGGDNGRVRTSYTTPANSDATVSATSPGWSLGPAVNP